MKIEEVVPYARAVKAMLDAHKARYVAYNPALDGTWEADVLDAQIALVNTMIITLGLINQNIEDIKARNVFMDALVAILDDLEFKIKLCIENGSITASLSSFGLAAFKRSIKNRSIGKFHNCYMATFAKINEGGNLAALNTAGFGHTQVSALTAKHTGAWELNDERIANKSDITTLSVDNQALITNLLGSCQLILDCVKGWGKANSDKVLVKSATVKRVLSSVRPTPAKEPKKRHFKGNTVNVFRTGLGMKYLIQLTCLTDGVTVTVCRQALKTAACTEGIVLKYNVMWEGKMGDIPGTGKYIIITVTGVKGVKVLYFVVAG